ncbi:MAG: IS110 family transposase [Vicinamibacterales bacterium]
MTTETRRAECSGSLGPVFMALELGSQKWKIACAVSLGSRPRVVQIAARDLERLFVEIARAKMRFGLTAEAPVRSCYEAGREGFWLHRALTAHGVVNVVVDASSIAVDRRARRVKTDRVDATALVIQLQHATAGDRRGWREVRVPSEQAEADRHLQREWETVGDDRKRIRNRIQGLLATHGLTLPLTRHFAMRLEQVRRWDASPLAPELIARLAREWTQLQQIEARQQQLRRLRRLRVHEQDDVVARQTRTLAALRGMAENGALTLTTELFAWRGFTNGRQIGAIVGLTPTPYRSDQQVVEQGISQSGNRRVRTLSVELAWCWIRWQPGSALTRWFYQRFGTHARARRIGIVAVARKLLIALWRYLEHGTLPEGARLKAYAGLGRRGRSSRSWCAPLGAGSGGLWAHRATEGAARPCSRLASMRRMEDKVWVALTPRIGGRQRAIGR